MSKISASKAHVERDEVKRENSDDERTTAKAALTGGAIQNPLRVGDRMIFMLMLVAQ